VVTYRQLKRSRARPRRRADPRRRLSYGERFRRRWPSIAPGKTTDSVQTRRRLRSILSRSDSKAPVKMRTRGNSGGPTLSLTRKLVSDGALSKSCGGARGQRSRTCSPVQAESPAVFSQPEFRCGGATIAACHDRAMEPCQSGPPARASEICARRFGLWRSGLRGSGTGSIEAAGFARQMGASYYPAEVVQRIGAGGCFLRAGPTRQRR
jgi:hypothetical protein